MVTFEQFEYVIIRRIWSHLSIRAPRQFQNGQCCSEFLVEYANFIIIPVFTEIEDKLLKFSATLQSRESCQKLLTLFPEQIGGIPIIYSLRTTKVDDSYARLSADLYSNASLTAKR